MPFTLAEITAIVGIRGRTVGRYRAGHVIPAPKPRGPRTVYEDLDVARMIVVRDAIRSGQRFLDGKRAARAMSDEQLREVLHAAKVAAGLVPPQPAPPPPPPPAPVAPPAAVVPPAPPPAPAPTDDPPSAQWSRVTLLPGLELHISAAASPLVKRIAATIAADARAASRQQ